MLQQKHYCNNLDLHDCTVWYYTVQFTVLHSKVQQSYLHPNFLQVEIMKILENELSASPEIKDLTKLSRMLKVSNYVIVIILKCFVINIISGQA